MTETTKSQFGEEILRLREVTVHFSVKVPIVQRIFSREKMVVHAVDGVSFALRSGEILGLVGESGCGKTTVGKTCVRLIDPTSGRIFFGGEDITSLGGEQLRRLRRRIQFVFQDPHASLNPAMTIGEAIRHPLVIHRSEWNPLDLGTNFETWATNKVLGTMTEVGLVPAEQLYNKYPIDLSGGQKQRAVIARAIITEPSLLVVDEGVSMLDMSIRAKILELMLDLRRQRGLTYLFITHDLATAKFICDRIAIMYLGRIVEIGPSKNVYSDPKHPYTKALLSAIPVPDPDKRRLRTLPRGEVPDAVHPPAGCRFHPRCPAALPTCGWEGRDFLDLLDEHLSDPNRAGEDEAILGPFEDWWANGLAAGRKTQAESASHTVERVRAVLNEGPPSMAEAIEIVDYKGGAVVVRFRSPIMLAQTMLEDRTVECLLYQ